MDGLTTGGVTTFESVRDARGVARGARASILAPYYWLDCNLGKRLPLGNPKTPEKSPKGTNKCMTKVPKVPHNKVKNVP